MGRLLRGLCKDLHGEGCPGAGRCAGLKCIQAIYDCGSRKMRGDIELFQYSVGDWKRCGDSEKLDVYFGGVRNYLFIRTLYLRDFKTGGEISETVFPGHRSCLLSYKMAECGKSGLWGNERPPVWNIRSFWNFEVLLQWGDGLPAFCVVLSRAR